jgi:MFS family permease
VSEPAGEAHGPYRRVLRNREARGLLIAQATSEIGDQIARVTVALLVLERTHSLLDAALVLALTYLPGILGEAALGSLADRYPRRAIMLICDALRVVIIGALALLTTFESVPLALFFVLLILSEFVSMPFGTARASIYPDVVPDRADYVTAQGMSRTVHLSTQVVGSIAGGALVQIVGVSAALAINAFAFAVSFLIVRLTVRERPTADEPGTTPSRVLRDMGVGAHELFSGPVRRSLIVLGWGSALFLIAPEAVALAYRPGQSQFIGGILLAAVPAGSALGALLLPQVPLRDQVRLLLPLAALSCVPLFATSVDPPPAVAAVLWFIAGVLQAFVLTIIAVVTVLTPRERRGRALGLASAGFNVATAAAFALIGWIAELHGIGPARAVSLAGAIGLVMVAVLRAVWPAEAIDKAL